LRVASLGNVCLPRTGLRSLCHAGAVFPVPGTGRRSRRTPSSQFSAVQRSEIQGLGPRTKTRVEVNGAPFTDGRLHNHRSALVEPACLLEHLRDVALVRCRHLSALGHEPTALHFVSVLRVVRLMTLTLADPLSLYTYLLRDVGRGHPLGGRGCRRLGDSPFRRGGGHHAPSAPCPERRMEPTSAAKRRKSATLAGGESNCRPSRPRLQADVESSRLPVALQSSFRY
jgi:hypothetical protein